VYIIRLLSYHILLLCLQQFDLNHLLLLLSYQLSICALNEFTDFALTACAGRPFQILDILLLKKFDLIELVDSSFMYLNWCPLVVIPYMTGGCDHSTISKPFIILNCVMRSPLILLSSRLVKFNLFNMSPYPRVANPGARLVALLCILSNFSICVTGVKFLGEVETK
jgi:hypothetical protein